MSDYKPSPKNVTARAKENAKADKYEIAKDARGFDVKFEDLPIAELYLTAAEAQLVAEYEAEHAAELAAEAAAKAAEENAKAEAERREAERVQMRKELLAELRAELLAEKK